MQHFHNFFRIFLDDKVHTRPLGQPILYWRISRDGQKRHCCHSVVAGAGQVNIRQQYVRLRTVVEMTVVLRSHAKKVVGFSRRVKRANEYPLYQMPREDYCFDTANMKMIKLVISVVQWEKIMRFSAWRHYLRTPISR